MSENPTSNPVYAVDQTPVSTATPEPPAVTPDALAEIQNQLAAAEKAKKAAEEALRLEKSAHSKLKNEHMSEAEKLAEDRQEIEALKARYMTDNNTVKAEKIFTRAGLAEEVYAGVLADIASADEEKTLRLANGFVQILEQERKLAAQKEREKVLDADPIAPAGKQAAPTVSAGAQYAKAYNAQYNPQNTNAGG